MRKNNDEGVIISAEGKDEAIGATKTSILKVEDIIKTRPKIILLGVPSFTSEKEVLECLFDTEHL